jgi:hypothetical protein
MPPATPCVAGQPPAWTLPLRGWGELHIERAEPYAGKEWTDSGRNRDQRPLKQRARGEI